MSAPHSTILMVVGLLGLLFYALAPVAFPHAPNLRQPELLPVYSLMIGLGGLLRKSSIGDPPIDPPITPPQAEEVHHVKK
jgi:hypothetical protein